MAGVPQLKEKFSVCIGPTCISDETRQLMRDTAAKLDDEYKNKILAALDQPDEHDKAKLALMQDDKTLEILGTETYLRELLNFKAHGPHGNKLFNNYVLNIAMKQLQTLEPTFKSFDCTLIDFTESTPSSNTRAGLNYLGDLLNYNFGASEFLTYGCILNTLSSAGAARGDIGHWVALFIDTRGKDYISVEYYNSTGSNAAKSLFKWMEKLAEHITAVTNRVAKAINVSNVRSQSGPSECGVYSFHYVICRLLGVPYKQFRVDKIKDADIQKLRAIFFNNQDDLGSNISKLLKKHIIL
jgi:hypothetical protein